jgi:hypothetical protein
LQNRIYTAKGRVCEARMVCIKISTDRKDMARWRNRFQVICTCERLTMELGLPRVS